MSERIARAHRAQAAWDEFIQPMIEATRSEYTGRLVEVASTELHPGTRADKLTTLSIALRVLEAIENGMLAAIKDGEMARAEKLRAERIENLSDARQRLLKVAGY